MQPRILLIGAGAVGQVYGHHLQKAGAAVTFLVRAKYRESLAQGTVLYALHDDSTRRQPLHFRDYGVMSEWSEVAGVTWDLVILCISTEALHTGLDLPALAAASGEATVLVLQPGPRDLALVTQHIAAERCVQGMITLSSYHTPMPGEHTAEPGTAYWLPPLTPMPLVGTPARRDAVIRWFKAGGIRARAVKDLGSASLHGNAFFMLFLEALESRGWSLSALRRDTALLRHLLAASREASEGIRQTYGVGTPLWLSALAPWMIQAGLLAAPRALPFDLQMFLQVHFTKVRPQTRLCVETFIDDARRHGLPTAQMDALHSIL